MSEDFSWVAPFATASRSVVKGNTEIIKQVEEMQKAMFEIIHNHERSIELLQEQVDALVDRLAEAEN